jgi:hypothetical protein
VLTLDIDASHLLGESDQENIDGEETSTVVVGRGRPAAMKSFVRSVLESALAK